MMRRYHFIALTALLLMGTSLACRITFWTRPGAATPTSSITPSSATPISSPVPLATATRLPVQPAGSGKILYLALQGRVSAAVQAELGPGAEPGGGATPGQPAPEQPRLLIQPVAARPSGGAAPGTPGNAPRAAPMARPEVYHLRRGEYPYCLARRYDIHPQDLMALNGLSYRQVFHPGQAIRLPHAARPFPGRRALRAYPATYTVRPGDSLYSIACDFGDLDPQALAQANGLGGQGRLKAGMQITVPAPGSLVGQKPGKGGQPPAPPQAAVPSVSPPGSAAATPATGPVTGPASSPISGAAGTPANRRVDTARGQNNLSRLRAAVFSPATTPGAALSMPPSDPAAPGKGPLAPWLGLPGRPQKMAASTPSHRPPVEAMPRSLLPFELTGVPASTRPPALSLAPSLPAATPLPLPQPLPAPTAAPTPRPTHTVLSFELPSPSIDRSQANPGTPVDLLHQSGGFFSISYRLLLLIYWPFLGWLTPILFVFA